jgi:hypothetical protein
VTAGITEIMSLTTLKGYLQIPLADTTYDTVLSDIFMPAALSVCERELGVIVPRTIMAERHSGGTGLLMLRVLPALYIINVEEGWGFYNWELTEQPVNSQPPVSIYAYSLDRPEEGMLTRRGPGNVCYPFVGGVDNIRVDYVAGRSAVPSAALLAYPELIGVWFRQSQLRWNNQASASFDALNEDFTRTTALETISLGVPYYVLELLKPDRRRPIIS